jgi:hypothetical protein
MKEKLVVVARFSDNIKADLARQVLEDEGIKAFVMGQNVGNVYSGVPAAVDIELQAPESQAQEAREILEANEQESRELGEDEEFDQDEDLEGEPEPDQDEQE